ncbi:MAG: HAD hydrolase family protein [Candidatus Eisenbacteria sp.]|nr:HAD hydrolase family protein [Candidatus Eisenbacteria bacterium]
MLAFDGGVAAGIKLLVLDVDGVLTNAHLVLGPSGEEIKEFSVRDGIGIKVAQFAGVEVVFLSARVSEIVKRRAEMLGVREVYQGEQQKLEVVRRIASKHGVGLAAIAYVGDDLVDMASIREVGIGVAVADACTDLLESARHVTEAPGGRGAVRETVEAILKARGDWKELVGEFLASI